jgi:hypothetical protein
VITEEETTNRQAAKDAKIFGAFSFGGLGGLAVFLLRLRVNR